MAVFFFLSDYKIGLTHLLLEQGIYLNMLRGIDFSFISGDSEQIPGLKEKASINGLHINYIKGLDTHSQFKRLTTDFLSLVNRTYPKVVHVQNNWQLAIVTFVKYFYFKRYKIVYTIHSYRHNHPVRSLITRLVLSIVLLLVAHKVVVASTFMKNKFALVKHKTSIIYFGVDDSFFKVDIPVKSYDQNNIVFAGQFREGKNQELIIRAAKHIHDLPFTNFRVFLAGNGPNLASCKKLVLELGLETLVIFTGNLERNEMLSLYTKCQVAVIATNIETFGHCIAEPFVLGLCTITRRTGIAEDIILHGINGYLFDKDEDILSLLTLIIGNENLKKQTGQSAFAARDTFQWANTIKRYINLYN